MLEEILKRKSFGLDKGQYPEFDFDKLFCVGS